MKFLFPILLLLISSTIYSQDSVRARVIKTSEKTLVYKVQGYKARFISFDCGCGLKRGDVFMISKNRFDSLLKEAKPVRRKDL